MTLDDTSRCPGRSDMGRLLGECSQCTRRDKTASAANVPPLVLLKSQGIEVCEGRRFHQLSIVDLAQSVTPSSGTFSPVSVIRRGDAK
jgi:hypothetical protein